MIENKILRFPVPPPATGAPERPDDAKVLNFTCKSASNRPKRHLRLLPSRHLVLVDCADAAESPSKEEGSDYTTLARFKEILFDSEAQKVPNPDFIEVIHDQFAEVIDNLKDGLLPDGTQIAVLRAEPHRRVLLLRGVLPDDPVITLAHTSSSADGTSALHVRTYITRKEFEANPANGRCFEVSEQNMLKELLVHIRWLGLQLRSNAFDEER